VLGIFERISNYTKMLIRISVSTFFVSLGMVALLRWRIPPADALLSGLPLTVKMQDLAIPLATVVVAGVVAVTFRIFRLHDRLSDVFGIRARFDIANIIFPLAAGSNANLSVSRMEGIRSGRVRIMRDVFYKYASSTKPVIDGHLVEDALDHWGWYWCFLEAMCLFLLGALVSAGFSHWRLCSALLFGCGVLFLLVFLNSRLCAQAAQREVEAILADGARRDEIGETFRAI
jgi:hypothetical protein